MEEVNAPPRVTELSSFCDGDVVRVSDWCEDQWAKSLRGELVIVTDAQLSTHPGQEGRVRIRHVYEDGSYRWGTVCLPAELVPATDEVALSLKARYDAHCAKIVHDQAEWARLRPSGYYWVIWRGEGASIARWGPQISHHPSDNPSWTWTDESGPDYDASDDPNEVHVLLGPLHLHCFNRDCLRGSRAGDRSTAEYDSTTFKEAGCECGCWHCDAGREAGRLLGGHV